MPGRVTVDKMQEFSEHPWGRGNLLVNGIQWEGIVNITNSVDEALYTAVSAKPFNFIPLGYPGGFGKLKEAEFGMVIAFKADNGDCIVTWKIEGREITNTSADKPWVALCADQVQTRPINASFKENPIMGYLLPQANFNAVPFEIRASFKANTNSVVQPVQARIKNSSYIQYRYLID